MARRRHGPDAGGPILVHFLESVVVVDAVNPQVCGSGGDRSNVLTQQLVNDRAPKPVRKIPPNIVQSLRLHLNCHNNKFMLVVSLDHSRRSFSLLLIRALLTSMPLLVMRILPIVQDHSCIRMIIVSCLRRITMLTSATNQSSACIPNGNALAVFLLKGISNSQ